MRSIKEVYVKKQLDLRVFFCDVTSINIYDMSITKWMHETGYLSSWFFNSKYNRMLTMAKNSDR